MKSFPVSPSSAGAGAALLLGLSLGLRVQDAPRTLAPARTRVFLCCLKGLGLKLPLSLSARSKLSSFQRSKVHSLSQLTPWFVFSPVFVLLGEK